MRSIFALGILIALCTSANAAKVRKAGPHHSQPRDVIVRPSQDEAVPPGWYKFPAIRPYPQSRIEILTPPTGEADEAQWRGCCRSCVNILLRKAHENELSCHV